MSVIAIYSLLKIVISLQIGMAAETHRAEGLTLKLWSTANVE
jgi:hypothetical protein